MSTVGTLYEKEIKLGHAKLLSSVSVAGVTNVIFSSALITPEFDVYYIDLNTVLPVAIAPLYLYVSDDNGATLKTANYWSSTQWTASHTAAGATASYPAHAVDQLFRITVGNVYPGHQVAGGVTFYRPVVPGYNPCFTWHVTTVQDTTYFEVVSFSAGFCAAVNVNYLLFTFSGSSFSGGGIRLYGLRRGA